MTGQSIELGLLALAYNTPPHQWLTAELGTQGRIRFDAEIMAATHQRFPWANPFAQLQALSGSSGAAPGWGQPDTPQGKLAAMEELRQAYEARDG